MKKIEGDILIAEETPEQSSTAARDKVLDAVRAGFNTVRGVARETGESEAVVRYELGILNNLYVTTIPGPPVTSYWLKGKEPKGKLFTRDGVKVEVEFVEPQTPAFHEKIGQIVSAPPPKNFEDVGENSPEKFKDLPLDAIEPNEENPRGAVDTFEQSFLQLVESIEAVGVQEPLIVTPNPKTGKFRIVMGHRRCAAAARAGRKTVPCVIRVYESREAELVVMLIENIQRQNLQPTQEGRAFQKLYRQSNNDVHAVARRLGLTQSYIITRMRLLKLDEPIQRMIDRREFGVSAGALLATLPVEQQKKLAPRAQSMKAADLKALVERMKTGIENPPKRRKKKTRVTTDDENFTRSWALRELDKAGDGAYFPAQYFREAFNDVCVDACLEKEDESSCIACPAPRLIAAMLRRRARSEEQK